MSAAPSNPVPPGFRFHPTDEELVGYYLRKKVRSERFDLDIIRDVDSNKLEPWDLNELCRIDAFQEAEEWYFFSHKDKKYPTGARTNRATAAGFWKATGRDKAVYSATSSTCRRIGMRKTLVFYRGRAPHGQKTDWIMHEYRLENSELPPCAGKECSAQEEGWVVCRVFKKRAHHRQAVVQVKNIINAHNRDASLGLNHANLEEEQYQPTMRISTMRLEPCKFREHTDREYYNMNQLQKVDGSFATSIVNTLTLNHLEGSKFLHLPNLESPEESIHKYEESIHKYVEMDSNIGQIKQMPTLTTYDHVHSVPKLWIDHSLCIVADIDDYGGEDDQWGVFESFQKEIKFSQHLGVSIPNHMMENHGMVSINEQSSLDQGTNFTSSIASTCGTYDLSLLEYSASKHDLELDNWLALERE